MRAEPKNGSTERLQIFANCLHGTHFSAFHKRKYMMRACRPFDDVPVCRQLLTTYLRPYYASYSMRAEPKSGSTERLQIFANSINSTHFSAFHYRKIHDEACRPSDDVPACRQLWTMHLRPYYASYSMRAAPKKRIEGTIANICKLYLQHAF